MPEVPQQRVHRSPRLSINALAHYVSAGAAKRERILREQKYPQTFRTNWYRDANRTIIRFLLSEDRDTDILSSGAERLAAATAVDRNERQRLGDNVAAITSFSACSTQIVFDRLQVRRGPTQGPVLVEGVTISVRPDVILTGQHRNADCLGAVKLYLSKNDRLTDDGAATIGSLLHSYMQSTLPSEVECNVRHCSVVDVFGRRCIQAPRAITRRRAEVEAACREIALRWPAL